MASVIFEERVEIPLGIRSLADFRRWALSDEFPQSGRIDYIGGRIEVDMSPEDFFRHGTLKTEVARALAQRVKGQNVGYLVTDRTRLSSSLADLSVEPDIIFISHKAIASGRVKLIPKASEEAGRYVEVEGGPDLIVEIVSDSSVAKDTRRLPKAYYAAGVREFWLADARGEKLRFEIHRRGRGKFRAVTRDDDGFQRSDVMGCSYRLKRRRDAAGFWTYDLVERA